MQNFWLAVKDELEKFISGANSAEIFRQAFYELVDNMPPRLDKSLHQGFEAFHEKLADFEPNSRLRLIEFGLVDEKQLKICAQRFLTQLQQDFIKIPT